LRSAPLSLTNRSLHRRRIETSGGAAGSWYCWGQHAPSTVKGPHAGGANDGNRTDAVAGGGPRAAIILKTPLCRHLSGPLLFALYGLEILQSSRTAQVEQVLPSAEVPRTSSFSVGDVCKAMFHSGTLT
jgi:hypothetical protein